MANICIIKKKQSTIYLIDIFTNEIIFLIQLYVEMIVNDVQNN